MNCGFPSNKVVTVWQGPDLPDLLPDGFEFRWRGHTFRHRPGGYTDGMSSPAITHAFPDISPRCWAFPGAIAHDGGYHDDLEVATNDGEWRRFSLTKEESDQMLHDLLLTLADTPQKVILAGLIYQAVHLGGQPSFDAGRSAARLAPG